MGMIMTSHILFKALDDVHPATMSRRIVHDLLRGELAFEGVVVSDDIGMRSVSAIFEEKPDSGPAIYDRGQRYDDDLCSLDGRRAGKDVGARHI